LESFFASGSDWNKHSSFLSVERASFFYFLIFRLLLPVCLLLFVKVLIGLPASPPEYYYVPFSQYPPHVNQTLQALNLGTQFAQHAFSEVS
jgi:hypothetical protein